MQSLHGFHFVCLCRERNLSVYDLYAYGKWNYAELVRMQYPASFHIEIIRCGAIHCCVSHRMMVPKWTDYIVETIFVAAWNVIALVNNESRTYLFSSVQFRASQLHQVRPFWTRNCVFAWFVVYKTMVIIIILLAWVCDHCSIVVAISENRQTNFTSNLSLLSK